jgi:hypothetical protein
MFAFERGIILGSCCKVTAVAEVSLISYAAFIGDLSIFAFDIEPGVIHLPDFQVLGFFISFECFLTRHYLLPPLLLFLLLAEIKMLATISAMVIISLIVLAVM